MTTPFTAYHKSRITYFKTLIKQLTHRIHRLKSARPTTKRAQYINYQQIQARRNLLAHNYNCDTIKAEAAYMKEMDYEIKIQHLR